MEMVNYCQAFFIDNDLEMYDPEADMPAMARDEVPHDTVGGGGTNDEPDAAASPGGPLSSWRAADDDCRRRQVLMQGFVGTFVSTSN